MWKITVTEIQDAGMLDAMHVPRGAFFVSTERFNKTVKNLNLPKLVSAINSMQSTSEYARKQKDVFREEIPCFETDLLTACEQHV